MKHPRIHRTLFCAAIGSALAVALLGGEGDRDRVRLLPSRSAPGYVNVKDPPYNARGDGSSDDAAAIQSALTAAASSGWGTVFFPPGAYVCASTLTIPAGTQGVTLLGAGSSTSGATLPSALRYTGSGATPFLSLGGTDGTNIRNLAITYTNPAFTGILVSFDSNADDSIYCVVENCFLGGGIFSTASALLALDLASQISVVRCNLSGAVIGIRGRTTHWSNVIRIRDSNFENMTSSAIRNPAQDWLLSGNNFIALASGAAGALSQDPGVCANAVTFIGNWFGDVKGGAAGAWISFCGNSLNLVGNFIGGGPNTTAVQIQGSSNFGISIQGNDFETHNIGIALGSGQNGVSIQGNTFADVTIPVSGFGNSNVVMGGNNVPATALGLPAPSSADIADPAVSQTAPTAQTVTLKGGVNSNVSAAGRSYLRIVGPTSAFSLGGFSKAADGERLTVVNSTRNTMTILDEDPGTSPGNRIDTLTGGDVVLRSRSRSAASFIYDGASARWVLVGTN